MNWQQLVSHIKDIVPDKGGPVVVAFSGGVDSSVVALAAHEVCGTRALALTVDSELVLLHELERAKVISVLKGFHHRYLPLNLLPDERVRENGTQRCYWCKHRIFSALRETFGDNAVLLDGTTADDDPSRPGMKAAAEFGVRSPLRDLGYDKVVVRQLAAYRELPNSTLPSNSCMATRVRQGQPLRQEVLMAIDAVENHLVGHGVNDLRARVDELMMTIHYPSRHAAIVESERKNVQDLIVQSVLEDVQFEEWQDDHG